MCHLHVYTQCHIQIPIKPQPSRVASFTTNSCEQRDVMAELATHTNGEHIFSSSSSGGGGSSSSSSIVVVVVV